MRPPRIKDNSGGLDLVQVWVEKQIYGRHVVFDGRVSLGTARVREDMQHRCSDLPYVLITPARNEEAFIEKTIRSVIRQAFLPVKWVIVDDGSTDSTAGIVSRYLARYQWIEMIQMP